MRHEYEHVGRLIMCERGYHASARVIDALRYAPGTYLCRVLSSRDIEDVDKSVSRYRRALIGRDVTMILHEFAPRIAYCALLAERERGREPHPDLWRAVAAKMGWCRGTVGDEGLITARRAAQGAAVSAAQSAAIGAAWSATDAAWSAAIGAAWSAAIGAAWSAADAAWSTADAARSAAYTAYSAARSAADAAESAAYSAAWGAADALLLAMLPEQLVKPELLEDRE
ncbi:MAG: hypothetical protein ACYTAN_18960 [Planctomycetota bacterium]|jgi:hypothetical protein